MTERALRRLNSAKKAAKAAIIKIASKNSKIVGADINELAPIKGFNTYNFLVAKLAYKILAYKFIKN